MAWRRGCGVEKKAWCEVGGMVQEKGVCCIEGGMVWRRRCGADKGVWCTEKGVVWRRGCGAEKREKYKEGV